MSQQMAQNENLQNIIESNIQSELEAISKEIYRDPYSIELENKFAQLCERARQIYGNDLAYPLAKFHYEYGNLVLKKLEATIDIFGDLLTNKAQESDQKTKQSQDNQLDTINEQKVEESQKDADEVLIQDENQVEQNNDEDKEIEELDQVEEKKQDDDYENIWNNLQTALKIYQLEKESLQSQQEQKVDDINLIKCQMSNCYMKLGVYENLRDQFNKAIEYFQLAEKYRSEGEENSQSRVLCEIKYLLATSYLYLDENREDDAILKFTQCIQILENSLSSILKIPIKDIKQSSEIQISDIEREHLKEGFLDNDESRNLKQILVEIYDKLEDTINQKIDQQQFQEIKEKQKQMESQENQFKKPTIENKPVKYIGIFGGGSIKRKPDQTNIYNNENKNTSNQNEENSNIILNQDKQEATQEVQGLQKRVKLD